jgi:fido (protein-threonine AMPylation protein)
MSPEEESFWARGKAQRGQDAQLPLEFFPGHSGIQDELQQRDSVLPRIIKPEDYVKAYSAGYRAAWDYLRTRVQADPAEFTSSHIQVVHRILYEGIYSHAGSWRRATNAVIFGGRIGADAVSILPELDLLERQMRSLVKWNQQIKTEKDLTDRLIFIAFYHARLILIHPFRDGNGRLARIIARWQEMCLLGLNKSRSLPRRTYLRALHGLPKEFAPLVNFFSCRYDGQIRFTILSPPYKVYVTLRPQFSD